jgi:glycosyltransferase involved in cell wall biosynthesis
MITDNARAMTKNEKPVIHLVVFGSGAEWSHAWSFGDVWNVEKTPSALAAWIHARLKKQGAGDAWFFWDQEFGPPDADSVLALHSMPGDVLHAGLSLGMEGKPSLFQFVNPTWMLNCDPDRKKVVTSWRLSLRACLLRDSIFRYNDLICSEFQTLEAASLDLGFRLIRNGAIVRHVPWLIQEEESLSKKLPFADESLFIFRTSGRKWTYWALAHAFLSGQVPLREVCGAVRRLFGMPRPQPPAPVLRPYSHPDLQHKRWRVSVLIPTIDRYPYLRKLLHQLGSQSYPPVEIIIVDQTPLSRRVDIQAEFPKLPVKLLCMGRPGQCSARNLGLNHASGEYILFLDDDVEIPRDLIESHIQTAQSFDASVCSGLAEEEPLQGVGAKVDYFYCSDVFPTGNSLVHRSAIETSGLFDLAYDCGDREDHDLGMRMYLGGMLMIFTPRIKVFHHHAPTGGLRSHGVNIITYKRSRRSLILRRLPSATLIYLWKRYFSPSHLQQQLRHSVASTFIYEGGFTGKILKIFVGMVTLPHTIWRIKRNTRLADHLLRSFGGCQQLAQQAELETASAKNTETQRGGEILCACHHQHFFTTETRD